MTARLRAALLVGATLTSFLSRATPVQAETDYDLWLRYPRVADSTLRASYRASLQYVWFPGASPMLAAARVELLRGLSGLLDTIVVARRGFIAQRPNVVVGTRVSRATVPESLLLWFHHVAWTDTLGSGRTLWNELALRAQAGVDTVRSMPRTWSGLRGSIDSTRFAEVQTSLMTQANDARWWRDAMLLYFQTYSRLPLPAGVER